MSKYDFEEEDEQGRDLNDIAKRLSQGKSSKDTLIKLLKNAGRVLEKADQCGENVPSAFGNLAKAVASKTIMDHKDKDVRICAAHCLCHVFRIYAPESPYTNAQLQDVFGLFMWVFRKLENPSSPSYQLTLSVLDTISQVKCCLLMLDFDNDKMVCDLFRVLLSTVNASNKDSVETAMLELMASMIEEADDVSQQLLDIILEHVVVPKQEEQPEAYRLAQRLMQRAEDRLQIYLQRLLTGIILKSGSDSALADEFANLVHQIHLACPQTLLPVLPLLAQELQAEEESRRLDAVDLLGQLFMLPGSDIDLEYSYLFEELMRRCKDQKVEVRLQVLQAAKKILGNCAQASSAKALQAVIERVQDFEDKVRSRAITVICEAAVAHPEAVTLEALEAVSGRLRDKKVAVRREAAQQLAAVFRGRCSRLLDTAAITTAEDEQVMWIPGRLLLAASRDTEVYSFILDSVFRSGFFPAKLPIQAAAPQWALLYASCSEQDRSALLVILRAKARAQQDVQSFLTARAEKSPSGSPFSASNLTKINQAIRRIAALFPDSSRAEEALQKVHELRDNHIFKGLALLCAPGTTFEAASKLGKDIVQRIGSKGFVGEFAKSLCARLTPNLVAPEHLEALLQLAVKEAGSKADRKVDDAVLPASLELLAACAAAAPFLFAHLGPKVAALLSHKDNRLGIVAAEILTHAASYMHQNGSRDAEVAEEQEDSEQMPFPERLKPLLLQLCSSGLPTAAKVAIRALSKVLSPAEALPTFQTLAKKLTGLLQKPSATSSPALPAALQALGTIGQVAPAVFAHHASPMADFVLDQLLEAPLQDCASGTSKRAVKDTLQSKTGGEAHPGTALKLLGIKALAKACVVTGTEQSAEIKQVTTHLVEQLLLLVNPENDITHLDMPGPLDEGCVRLGAASALLKLALSQDSPVSADSYLQLALTMQDPIMEVRQQFAKKIHRMVQDLQKDASAGHRAAKWAAVLPLAAMDPTEANCSAAFAFLMEYVVHRRHAVQQRVTDAASNQTSGGTILHEYPDFILPFLIQSLAHHPDFPGPEDVAEDAAVLEPFQKMLQFALEPLLIANPAAPQAGSMLPVVQKILRSLKHTEDATTDEASDNVYVLCDVALILAAAIAKSQQPKGKAKQPSAATFPGNVPLPASFYRSLDMRISERKADGSHLPEGFEVVLVPFMPQQASPAEKAKREAKPKGQGKAAKEEATPGKGRGAKAGRKRKSNDSKDSGSAKKPKRRTKVESESEEEQSEEEAEEEESDPEHSDQEAEPMQSSSGQKGRAATASAEQKNSGAAAKTAGGQKATPLSGKQGSKGTASKRQLEEDAASDADSQEEEEAPELQPSRNKRAKKSPAAPEEPSSPVAPRSASPAAKPKGKGAAARPKPGAAGPKQNASGSASADAVSDTGSDKAAKQAKGRKRQPSKRSKAAAAESDAQASASEAESADVTRTRQQAGRAGKPKSSKSAAAAKADDSASDADSDKAADEAEKGKKPKPRQQPAKRGKAAANDRLHDTEDAEAEQPKAKAGRKGRSAGAAKQSKGRPPAAKENRASRNANAVEKTDGQDRTARGLGKGKGVRLDDVSDEDNAGESEEAVIDHRRASPKKCARRPSAKAGKR